MNKVIFILLFLVGLYVFGQPYPSAGLPISHDQFYVVLEFAEASNDDYVGEWHVNFIDSIFKTRTGVYTHSITAGNTNNAFKMSDSMIMVNDYTKLNHGSNYTLTIQTCVDGNCESNYAYIEVLDADKTIFIDPSYGGGGNGDRSTPYDSWGDVSSKTADYVYLQKRGESSTLSATISNFEHGVIMAAYGQGAKPILTCAGNLGGHVIYIDEADVKIYDYTFDELISEDETIKANADSVKIYRPTFYYDTGENFYVPNIYLYDFNYGSAIYDYWGYYTGEHHLKLAGSFDTVINAYCLGEYNNGNGLSLAFGDNYYVRYVCAVNDDNGGTNGYDINADTVDIKYGYVEGFYRGVEVQDEVPLETGQLNDITISNVYVDMTVRGAGAQAACMVVADNVDGIDGVTIKNSVFKNCDGRGAYVANNNPVNISFEYCLFIDNNGNGIEVANDADYVTLYNCISYNNSGAEDIYENSSGANHECKNTFYQVLTGTWATATNIDLDGIVMGDYFVDYSNGDWQLKETAVNAIDNGTDLSLTETFYGDSPGASPDIGIDEYAQESSRKYPYLFGTKQDPKLNGVSKKFILSK